MRGSERSGQALLIAILTLSGAILGVTALAGLLMLYQSRSATDSRDSAKAVFAADTGINWALYSYFTKPYQQGPMPGKANPGIPAGGQLSDGTTITVTCLDGANPPNEVTCANAPNKTSVLSEGEMNGSRRAFEYDLADATSTLP